MIGLLRRCSPWRWSRPPCSPTSGIETVRTSRAGQVVSTVTDPAAPGFEALPRADADARPAPPRRERAAARSRCWRSTPGDVGGSVLLVSPGTLRERRRTSAFNSLGRSRPSPAVPRRSLRRAAERRSGSASPRSRSSTTPAGRSWSRRSRRSQVENPTAVGPFPAGPITLAADQVGPYLAARNDGRERPQRRRAPPASVLPRPGSTRSRRRATRPRSRARSTRASAGSCAALAGGPHRVETVPVVETAIDGGLRHDDRRRRRWPRSSPSSCRSRPPARPGGRVRVRLLDGTGDPEHVAAGRPARRPRRRRDRGRGQRRRLRLRGRPRSATTTRRCQGGRRATSRSPRAPGGWSMILARPTRSMSPSCSAPTCRSDRPG